MTVSHDAWEHLMAMLEDVGVDTALPAETRGKITQIFDLMTATTIATLTKGDMAIIGDALIGLGSTVGTAAVGSRQL